MNREYDNNNTGALFRNETKEEPNHPDYRGSAEVGGEQFWLAAWLKTSKKGQKFMSLSFKPKEERRAEPVIHPNTDVDLPF